MIYRISLLVILISYLTLISCDLNIQDTNTTTFHERAIQLTESYRPKSEPAWSPDGTMIAYAHHGRATNLISVSLDESDMEQVGRIKDAQIYYKFDISPDGTKIVYHCSINKHLWIANLQTGSKFSLTSDHRYAYLPAWSADGDWIAYCAYRENSSVRNIWKIPAIGGTPIELTNDESEAYYPCWSPDGKKIAYQTVGNNNYIIKIINIERNESSQLTPDSVSCYYPDWSPDGMTIAYYSHRKDTTAIYTIPAEGGKETKLTNMVRHARYPAWSPDGSKIAYCTYDGIWIASSNGEILHEMNISEQYPVWWPDGNALVDTKSVTTYSTIEVFSFIDSTTNRVTNAVDLQFDRQPTWYPDSKTIAFSRSYPGQSSASIFTISILGGEAKLLIDASSTGDYMNNPAISPDGNWLVFNDRYRIFLVPLPEGEPIDLSQHIGYNLTEPAWASNSKGIVCSSPDGLMIISTDSSFVVDKKIISGNFKTPTWSAIHPVFGSHIAAEGSDGIYIISPDDTTHQERVSGGRSPTWSPDGTRLGCIIGSQLYVLPILVDLSNL